MARITPASKPPAVADGRLPRWVALLRGINVGAGPRLAMADLRVLLEELGFAAVRTLLASGNAVFAGKGPAADIALRIQRALAERHALSLRVIVKSAAEVAAIVAGNPLAGVIETSGDASRMLVAVAADAASLRAVADVESLVRPPDRWWLGEHALFLWCPAGVLASPAAAALLGPRGAALTTRNWATFTKIAALLGTEGAARADGAAR